MALNTHTSAIPMPSSPRQRREQRHTATRTGARGGRRARRRAPEREGWRAPRSRTAAGPSALTRRSAHTATRAAQRRCGPTRHHIGSDSDTSPADLCAVVHLLRTCDRSDLVALRREQQIQRLGQPGKQHAPGNTSVSATDDAGRCTPQRPAQRTSFHACFSSALPMTCVGMLVEPKRCSPK
jgi:hypothetical protein